MLTERLLWVLHRGKSPRLPGESAVLLDETLQGTASWSTVQPNRHGISWWSNGRLEDEEQSSG